MNTEIASQAPAVTTTAKSTSTSSRFTRSRTLIALSLGCLLPVVSIGIASIRYGSYDVAIAALVRRDAFAFSPSQLELNGVVPGSTVDLNLMLYNLGSTDLTIVEGRPSCSCISVPLAGKRLQPGERLPIHGTLISRDDSITPQSYRISLWLDKCDEVFQIPITLTFAASH